MQGSTKKLTTDYQTQIVHLVDCTNVFGATTVWRTRQSFKSKGPWFLQLYSMAQTWVAYRSHIHLLDGFHQRSLRIILNIRWSDFITNDEVLEQAEIPSSEAMLLNWYWSTSSDGQDMFPEWRTIVYQRLPCMVNNPLATEIEQHEEGWMWWGTGWRWWMAYMQGEDRGLGRMSGKPK